MLKPGALAGVNVLDLSRLLPGPYCSITGYGQDGLFRDRVGHDANYLSKAGVLGVPAYAELQYNDQRRKEIIDYMRKTFKQKTLDEWDAILGDLDICWGRVQSLSEVLEDPLFRQREMVVEIKGNDGKTSKTLGVPVKLSESPGAVRTPPVDFGASTSDILRELGYSEKEIERCEKEGVT